MDIRDILSVIGALLVIIVVAVIVQPGAPDGDSPEGIVSVPQTSTIPYSYSSLPSTPRTTPTTTESNIGSLVTPAQIYYDKNYFSYPLFIFPDFSLYFESGSDIPWSGKGIVEFAYIQGTTGGVTQLFNVPYRIWKINCTVVADTNPAYAKIKWMLVNARNGAVIKGAEFQGSGTFYKTVFTYQTDMYFVIQPSMIDYYTIKLETMEKYM